MQCYALHNMQVAILYTSSTVQKDSGIICTFWPTFHSQFPLVRREVLGKAVLYLMHNAALAPPLRDCMIDGPINLANSISINCHLRLACVI